MLVTTCCSTTTSTTFADNEFTGTIGKVTVELK